MEPYPLRSWRTVNAVDEDSLRCPRCDETRIYLHERVVQLRRVLGVQPHGAVVVRDRVEEEYPDNDGETRLYCMACGHEWLLPGADTVEWAY